LDEKGGRVGASSGRREHQPGLLAGSQEPEGISRDGEIYQAAKKLYCHAINKTGLSGLSGLFGLFGLSG
jgi:hypothetical protein